MYTLDTAGKFGYMYCVTTNRRCVSPKMGSSVFTFSISRSFISFINKPCKLRLPVIPCALKHTTRTNTVYFKITLIIKLLNILFSYRLAGLVDVHRVDQVYEPVHEISNDVVCVIFQGGGVPFLMLFEVTV